MQMEKLKKQETLEVKPEGRLDTNTSEVFQKEILADLDGVSRLELNFEHLQYVSSAGLRALLTLQKIICERNGEMVVSNVDEMILDLFEMTGFKDILNIQ